jgi:transposase
MVEIDPRDERIAELEARVAARDARIAELTAMVEARTGHVAELEARLGQNSTNSSRPPSAYRKDGGPVEGEGRSPAEPDGMTRDGAGERTDVKSRR